MNNKKYHLYFKLIVILITLITASYSWFSNGDKLKMDSLMISTRAVQSLSFSLDGGITWDDDTSLNIDESFKFNSEITGNGINLFVPSQRREDGTPISFKEATTNKDYLEFEIMFKSDNPTSIFLGQSSFIKPAIGDSIEKLIGENVERKSSMGDFTRDLIAGSVRVAFVVDDEIKMVWAPNPEYELIKNQYGYTFDINSANSQNYTYLNPVNLKELRLNGVKDNINASYANYSGGGDPILLNFDSSNEIKKVLVRIWVEGNDRETSTALKGGIFRLFFDFIGISKSENTSIPDLEVVDNEIIGFDDSMEYSIDYGNHWNNFNDNLVLNNESVYVRYKETFDYFASDYQIINF